MNLHPYQVAGARFLSTRPGALLCDAVGLGKTIQAVAATKEVGAKRVLLVSPKNLKPWWLRTIGAQEEHRSKSFPIAITADQMWVLANYEQFVDKGPAEWLLDQKWDVVILDEAHKIKNAKAQRTRNIKRLSATYRWGLTASPIADKPIDLWSLLNWVAPHQFTSRWRFIDKYTEVTFDFFGRRKIGAVTNLQGLRKEVRPYLLSRTREEVGQELPPLSVEDIWLELEPAQQTLYNMMETQFLVELHQDLTLAIPTALARFTRLHQVASCPITFGCSDNTKLTWFQNYLESGGPPAVIMTRYLDTAGIVKNAARARGQDFLVGTFSSLAEGHNLQDWSHLIIWDMCYSRQMYEQAVGRVYRQGQTKPVTVLRLLAEHTVDEDVLCAVEHKLQEADLIMEYLRRRP